MRIIETTVYQYNELSESAKQKARNWYTGEGFEFYADNVIEDVQQIASILGVSDCEVLYSGFWSQGDGACINGSYRYAKNAPKKITEYCNDVTLLVIATQLQNAQRKAFYKTRVKITHSGGYYHYNSMDFQHDNELYPDLDDRSEPCKELEEAFRMFAKWIYRQLESEYENQVSEEVVAETIEVNACEFLEDGSRA